MNKKGQIWISAALYTALGIILIGLVLSVGMPFISKIQMRNTLKQTEKVMFDIDKVIREVWNEGLGSKRPIFVEIQEGDFLINEKEITWTVISEDKLGIEPDLPDDKKIRKGNLIMSSTQLGQGYEIELKLEYDAINLETTSETMQLSGGYNLVIEKVNCGEDEVCVKIKVA